MTNEYVLPLPTCDEWGVPQAKMPNCPHCGDDELGMVQDGFAVCYRCQAIVVRHKPNQSITAVPLRCADCSWMGRLEAAEPNDDGELCCPQCLNVIVVKTPEVLW